MYPVASGVLLVSDEDGRKWDYQIPFKDHFVPGDRTPAPGQRLEWALAWLRNSRPG